MEDRRNETLNREKKRKTIAAIVAVCAVVIVLFLFLFSLFHLPERDPVEDPEWTENADATQLPASDFEETNEVMSGTQEQDSEILGELEMQYENAKLNAEAPAAQQAGMRLALAYWKAGETEQAKEFVKTLMANYSYDTDFVEKCRELLTTFDKPAE